MLWLDDSLRPHIPEGREFEFVFALEGEVFRAQKNRRMIRTTIGGRPCFVKTHGPAAWKEIVKNASRGRWPTLTAEPEFNAIRRCEELGVPTVHAIGFGVRGKFPTELESFIITAELSGYLHLDELPPAIAALPNRQRVRLHRALIADVARIARLLHTNGLNHRDFYLNHFMLPQRDWAAWNGEELRVHLIDLHRMQTREHTPRKWVIKDISGLLFSAFDAGLTSRDWLRFLEAYWRKPWRGGWSATRVWRWHVMRRAVSLYRSERGRPPPLPGGFPSSA
jgi:heptose I phosphotransferase